MKNERQEQILKILNEKEFATVNTLADTLYVSLPTVRRDLTELAKKGLIRRSHGGAAAVNDKRLAVPFDFRTGSGRDIKVRMSRAAAALVSDGDTVFIDGSTSCMQIAGFLKERCGITLVTNSAHLAGALCGTGFDIHCTGGRLIESSRHLWAAARHSTPRTFISTLCFFPAPLSATAELSPTTRSPKRSCAAAFSGVPTEKSCFATARNFRKAPPTLC